MEHQVVEWDGFAWVDYPGYDDHIGFSPAHEPEVAEWLSKQRGECFVDVGAHVGRYTLRLAANFDVVYALEPNPESRFHLCQNLLLNDIKNVAVLPFAAWDKREDIKFGSTPTGPASMQAGDGPLTVVGERLDRLIEHADLIKLDVEGADEKAVRGMEWLCRTSHPTLLVENHDFVTPGGHAAVAFRLASWGYSETKQLKYGAAEYSVFTHKDKL